MINVAFESVSEACADFFKQNKILVLHVDDDKGFLAVAKQCLEEQGQFQVDTANSVEEAREKLKKNEYDVVVADYQMPGKNGLELLKALRQEGNDVPFILLTCKDKEEIAIEALNSGVYRYVDKKGGAEAIYEELKRNICNAVRRRRAEKLLIESENRLRQITENMKDMLLLTDMNLIITDASASHKWTLGYEPNEMIGKPIFNFIHPDDLPIVMKIAEKALENRTGGEIEARFKRADGSYLLLDFVGKVLTDDKGQITGTVVTSRDITERKIMEQSLKESEEKYRKLFEEALDAIFIADPETGILLDCNHAATALIGKEKSELIGMHQRFLHPEEKTGKFSKTFEQHLTKKEGQIVETQIIQKNGKVRDVSIKANLIEVNDKKMLQGIFRDVTESKKGIDKIGFQARLLNAVGQAIVATDTNGIIVFWNHGAEELYGWSEAEALGFNMKDFIVEKIVQEPLPDAIKRLKTGERLTRETVLERRDGTLLTVIITISPITDDKGELIGIIGVSTDITEQKWMQEVLEQAIKEVAELNEKLRVVEGLTRHDIRNKLSAMNGGIYLLKKRIGNNEETLQQLKDMEAVSQQMSRILEFEKIYIQVGAEELKNVDVETQVNEAASLFSNLKGAKIVNECHGLTVLADSLLRQLFYNLIDNTLKYGEKTSTIRVHYEEETNQLKLVYEDDGVGIPAEMKSNLFTEGYGRGTGYGLYLLKRICETYGWMIEETGKAGQGVQFTMLVPKNGKDGKRSYEIS